MQIEELKLVIETIKSLSGDATTAFIWWMVFDIVKYTLFTAALITVTAIIARIISDTREWAMAGRRVAKAYGASGHTMMYSSDEAAIEKAIQEGKQ
jgi:hypothetical protein